MTPRHFWLVERYLGSPTDELLAALAAQTTAAVRDLAARGVEIAYLGSTAIPGEDTCFCVFASHSPAAVEQVNAGVSAPCVRIVDALAAGHPPPR
jgi:hypothetical protein